MTGTNKIIIAAAGSGKTTYLVREALEVKNANVLIMTYTESNEAEIKRKIMDIHGHIPPHISINTWFTFLISHGVKPFQGGLFDFRVKGMVLMEQASGYRFTNKQGRPVYWGEKDFRKYYFDSGDCIYSDKLSKLVIRCNEKSNGSVFDRLSRIYKHIFIDEVQDLAGYDLDILVGLFCGPSNILLVGDPRQVTYQTHHERRYSKYSNGNLLQFFKVELPKGAVCEIDETTLSVSHRNSAAICAASAKLFPQIGATQACSCADCQKPSPVGSGLFVVRQENKTKYLEAFEPIQLRYNASSNGPDRRFPVLNFGEAKGLGFDHIAIYPTKDMVSWMKNNAYKLKDQTRAKFYVALTRARHSVAIIHDFEDGEIMEGFKVYE